MKKNIFFQFIIFLIFIPLLVSAALPPAAQTILDNLKGVVYTIFFTIAACAMIFAGILFATAAGDPQKLETAKKALIWGVAGIIVGLIGGSIPTILEEWLINP